MRRQCDFVIATVHIKTQLLNIFLFTIFSFKKRTASNLLIFPALFSEYFNNLCDFGRFAWLPVTAVAVLLARVLSAKKCTSQHRNHNKKAKKNTQNL